ncbi:MAG: hypothetical protein HYY06_20310 [Deltaproteobacteria bacterium]|nr:hypothetical protein [Deltaproteobacteria bacterium]
MLALPSHRIEGFRLLRLPVSLVVALSGGCAGLGPDESSRAAEAEAPAELGMVSLAALATCTGELDPQADLFYARDVLRCRFRLPHAPGVRWGSVTVGFAPQGEPPPATRHLAGDSLDGEEIFRFSADSYPMELSVTLGVAIEGSGAVGSDELSNGTSLYWGARRSIASRQALAAFSTESPLAIAAPFDLWQVALWPSAELGSAWSGEQVSWLQYSVEYSFPISSDALNVGGPTAAAAVTVRRTRWTHRADQSDLGALTREVVHLPVPRGGFGNAPPAFQLRLLGETDVEGGGGLVGPGYYVVSRSGQTTRTAIDQLPPTGSEGPAENPDGGAPVDETDGGSPTAPPDPCAGACTVSQACVSGGCVDRGAQTQSEYCSSPSRSCDPGEDGDCADGHACVGGLCRRLGCQTQSDYCSDPIRPCDGDDSDCADGHACVGGLCRRLGCQTQSDYCSAPTRPCDGEDADCAESHACVGGLCRRLGCQTQSEYCSDATRPCDVDDDADCAPEHACAAGLCRRVGCQTQSEYCSAPTRACDPGDDGDCAPAHTCVEGRCRRATCE